MIVPKSGTCVNELRTAGGSTLPALRRTQSGAMSHPNSFSARDTLRVRPSTSSGRDYTYFRLAALGDRYDLATMPYSLKILLENLIRNEDGRSVTEDDVAALASWQPGAPSAKEIAYRPARVLLQDFTGVPCVVDLAAMRDAIAEFGGDPKRINPLQPVELVIDHSVQVDAWASPDAFEKNAQLEFERNGERYAFLKWGQSSLDGFRAVPPDTGIVHQVNIEYLARVIFGAGGAGEAHPGGTTVAYPDTVVGTDSHTTMANGLGVLAWGVGGIEAEAAMLGQPVTMLIPDVIGFKLTGKLREGVTATDLALQITQMLRKKGVVGKFVEFYGAGLSSLPVADRTVIGNMSPEYGSTVAIFPIDALTLDYLRLTGRAQEQIDLVEAYAKAQGMFRTDDSPEPRFSDTLALDLSDVVPNLAGPRRPQDRVPLTDVKATFNVALEEWQNARGSGNGKQVDRFADEGGGTAVAAQPRTEVSDGAVVIAAITSCTNTSNPSVLLAAGLLAKKAVEAGLTVAPHIKTSLAPGSRIVTEYLTKTDLMKYLDKLGFTLAAYGCTTCIGNAGDLTPELNEAITKNDIVAAAVLSGNRNFEARIHPNIRANFLASPPLVVAYAIAGNITRDLMTEPVGKGKGGRDIYLGDIWPTSEEVDALLKFALDADAFRKNYSSLTKKGDLWSKIEGEEGQVYDWPKSTYIAEPPFFGKDFSMTPADSIAAVKNARALGIFGDSVTTDHISPAGSIKEDSPAGKWLKENGVQKADFNSYGSRRGNHDVMMRGTFANVRIKNLMIPAKADGSRVEGGLTIHQPSGEQLSIYDAAMKYIDAGTPTIVFAGEEYGTGSSRDWAAKGTQLLGVKAVVARSFERIHRSNLVGMGVLPLQFKGSDSVQSLGITGEETYDIEGLGADFKPQQEVTLVIRGKDGKEKRVPVLLRIDTPIEVDYYKHGGILPFVLRSLLAA